MLISGKANASRRSVLIVDQSSESREVLRTVLQRRGLTIYEASGAGQALELVRRHHPGVIVLDLETDGASEGQIPEEFGAESAAHRASLVLLGNAARRWPAAPGRRVLPKPYHYAPLIRTIEELLERSQAAERSG